MKFHYHESAVFTGLNFMTESADNGLQYSDKYYKIWETGGNDESQWRFSYYKR